MKPLKEIDRKNLRNI